MDHDQVLEEIRRERFYQDAKWGGPRNDDLKTMKGWGDLIGNYVKMARGLSDINALPFARKRFIQVAALCVAAIEAIDRKRENDEP